MPPAFVQPVTALPSRTATRHGVQPRRPTLAPRPRTTPPSRPRRASLPARACSEGCDEAGAAAPALRSATGSDARLLACYLAAHWSNRAQAIEFPTFWSFIHVVFRPLPWDVLEGYAFYTESAYDYNLGLPYKSSVVHIVRGADGSLELATYKPKDAEEFWMGAHEPHLLDGLDKSRLTGMSSLCNSVFEAVAGDGADVLPKAFVGRTREGKLCRIRRGGKEKETYLDSTIEVGLTTYKAWDVGRDPETEERVWGTPAGPFEFECVDRLDHLVPPEPVEEAAGVGAAASAAEPAA